MSDIFRQRLKSFQYAFAGLAVMLRRQPNFFIHLILAALALIMAWYFKISKWEWLWIVFSIGLVLSAEIFNTAIENLTDLIEPEKNPKAGKVKDLAAAAVLTAAITALIIGLIIFLPRILS